MPAEGEGYRDASQDTQAVDLKRLLLESRELNNGKGNSLALILDKFDITRHREALDLLLQEGSYDAIEAVMDNLPHFKGIPPMEIIDLVLGTRYAYHVYQVDDAILEQAGVDHVQFIQKLRVFFKAAEAKEKQEQFYGEREITRGEKTPRNIKDQFLESLPFFGKKPDKSDSRTDFNDMINILRTDGYKFTNLRGDPDERAIEEVRPLYEMLDWVKDWEQFLSKEVMFRSSQDSPELHHCEVTQFTQMYKRLIEFYSQDKIKVIADACRAENIVDFMNQFNEAGRAKIIEKITNRQREYFEVAPEANVWRYGNIESLNMEQYLTNLENRKEACGRLLVHVTKDSLFEHLLSDPKLKSGAMVHIAVGARSGSSRFLGERTGHYEYTAAFDQPFGISIAAHFSFDDALEYPDGQFAAVFAAEALFNNYAYSEMDKIAAQKGTDVGFGGLTNDYFNDPTHQIDIQKYGFFLVPERYQNNHLGQQLAKKGLRVFYYKGLLVDGIKELRKQIGSAEQKPKLVRELKFKRRIGVPHDVTQNKPRYAQVHIANQLEYAGEAAKKGKNIFPDDDYLVWHMGRGGGKGNYFSV